MKILDSKRVLCSSCMEEHEVKTISVMDKVTFKGIEVEYEATYFYCENTDELFVDETQMRNNDINLKDAYRKMQEVLTSKEIVGIRDRYGITQKDLCAVLGWGAKTITRYESYQIPDRAHNTILKKIGQDPEWFLNLLINAKDVIGINEYKKYLKIATILYEQGKDLYLRKSIEAGYARFNGNKMLQGNVMLSFGKIIDVIKYFAASRKVTNLYKVKLMKLMWYADALSFKNRGHSITGLVYQALQMGAVPVGHDAIINLKGVPCEEVDMGETYAYYFNSKSDIEFEFLNDDDKVILNNVIDKLGCMSKDEIIAFMHKEKAYVETEHRGYISFRFAEFLQI